LTAGVNALTEVEGEKNIIIIGGDFNLRIENLGKQEWKRKRIGIARI